MIYAFNGKEPKIDETTFVSENAVIIGDVTIGPGCYIGPGATIRADFLPVRIGEQVVIEDGVIVHAGGRGTEVVIGNRVTMGHGAIVHALVVGNDVGIGMGAIISLNTELGDGCIIAEGALVRQGQKVPAGALVGGIPAKELRPVEEKDKISWQRTTKWYTSLAKQLKDPSLFYRIEN
ncbi:MAG: gamma carbonic anhydrase family protein [Oscillospiraceae bacterium]|nr:gamma carbonic anhydrase family protein [Oscillospiraceae bacterium]